MTFIPRPQGTTLRRAEEAVYRPHDSKERVDPDFPVAMRCELCGKVGYGPRSQMREAIREHRESDCPKRHTHADEPQVTRFTFPRT